MKRRTITILSIVAAISVVIVSLPEPERLNYSDCQYEYCIRIINQLIHGERAVLYSKTGLVDVNKNASFIIQEALSKVSASGSIYIKGNYQIDSPILILTKATKQ